MAARSRPQPARQSPSSRAAWLAPAVIGVLAFLAYANSLSNGFVWDDPIILSRQLVVFAGVGDVLAPPRNIPQFSPDYYRPLTIATYLLDRAIGGGAPFPFHLSVVLAHAATSVLVYLLAAQLLGALPPGRVWPSGAAGDGVGAFTAAALFALHPIHTESVAWAAGRSDVLATGFLLAALVVHGRGRRSWRDPALAGICALAALGAKETAVALYPLMLLRDALEPSRRRRTAADWLRDWSGPLAALIVYALLRHNALGEAIGSAEGALHPAQRSPLDVVGAIGVYLARLLWPLRLNAYIDTVDTGWLPLLLSALLAVAAAAALWHWWHRRTSAPPHPRTTTHAVVASNPAVPLFALAWLLLTLIPSLVILWKIPDAPLAERYLYLPSVGFCLLVGDAVGRLWRVAATPARQRGIALGLAAILLLCAGATARRNAVWHDDIALWEDTEAKSRTSGMAARSLGTAYQQVGRTADARAAFERALHLRNTPRGLQTLHNNLGTLAMYDGDWAAAQRHYEKALAANPNGADTMFNLGLAVLHAGGRSPDAARAALVHYRHAQAINPHDSDIEAALAEAYDLLGDSKAAAAHANRALELGARGQTADSLRGLLQRTR